jgi:NAD+ diphosphatase
MDKLSYWLLRCENQLFTTFDKQGKNAFPTGRASDFGSHEDALLVGQWRGLSCYAADCDKLPENISGELMPVRGLLNLVGEDAVSLIGRAIQLLDWQRNHRFCGRCGAPNARKTGEYSMLCAECGLVVYPRISPVVMVLISRGDELLLARSHRFKPGVYSALAGFVEAGETLEQCARREVLEEVGIEITNLRYFGSQPWPFPDSLMMAFFADYAAGTINPDPKEIEDAKWFPLSELPLLPEPVTLARKLIEAKRSEETW